jgi:hypothetical protein
MIVRKLFEGVYSFDTVPSDVQKPIARTVQSGIADQAASALVIPKDNITIVAEPAKSEGKA